MNTEGEAGVEVNELDARAGWLAASGQSRVRPADLLTLGILVVVVVTIAVRWGMGVDLSKEFGVHLGLLAGYGALTAVMARSAGRRWVHWARPVAVVAVMFTLYHTLAHLAFRAIPWVGDAWLAAADRLLFQGADPVLEIARQDPGDLVEFFSVIYGLFIPYIHLSILMGCLGRPEGERERFVTGFALLYALSFLGYLFVPARGPVVHLAEEFPGALAGGFFHQLVVASIDRMGGPHGAMPSLHIGASVFACGFDLRYNRLRGLTYLPVVVLIYAATLVLRYHYVIDLVAGTLLGIAAIRLAVRWVPRTSPPIELHGGRETAFRPLLAWTRRAVARVFRRALARQPHPESERVEDGARALDEAAELVVAGSVPTLPLGANDEAWQLEFLDLRRRLADVLDRPEGNCAAGAELAGGLTAYRSELHRLGIAPSEVFIPMDVWRAGFFVVRELELVVIGLPLAVWGALTHYAPGKLVVRILRRRVRAEGEPQGIAGTIAAVFAVYYLAALVVAGPLLPGWGKAVLLGLPFFGMYVAVFDDRVDRILRRSRSFLLFWRKPALQTKLASEGRRLANELRTRMK